MMINLHTRNKWDATYSVQYSIVYIHIYMWGKSIKGIHISSVYMQHIYMYINNMSTYICNVRKQQQYVVEVQNVHECTARLEKSPNQPANQSLHPVTTIYVHTCMCVCMYICTPIPFIININSNQPTNQPNKQTNKQTKPLKDTHTHTHTHIHTSHTINQGVGKGGKGKPKRKTKTAG